VTAPAGGRGAIGETDDRGKSVKICLIPVDLDPVICDRKAPAVSGGGARRVKLPLSKSAGKPVDLSVAIRVRRHREDCGGTTQVVSRAADARPLTPFIGR
jgi:hypothetical protein